MAHSTRPGILIVVPGLLALSTVSLAGETEGVLEEVLVTAQFRSERLQDTPIAITAITADMLQQRSQTSVQEVAAQAPNVTLTRASAAFGPSVSASIRGIGQYDFNPAVEPGVGMYVDDVYYSSLTGTIFDLLDLERVEILRGPQGTLAGRNSIGGAVKLFSKRPTGDGSGFIEASYGAYNRVDVRGSADFALVPEKLLMRLSGVTKQRDGFFSILDYGCLNPGGGVPPRNNTDDCKVGEQSGIDYSGARASLLWVAADSVDVNIIADYTHDTSSPPGNVLVFANNSSSNVSQYPGVTFDSRFVPTGEAYYNFATFNAPDGTFTIAPGVTVPIQGLNLSSRSDFQGWGVSAQVNWKISDALTLTSITAHREFDAAWQTDGDYSPLQVALGADELEHRQFSQELRLNGAAGAVDYTVGAYFFDQKSVYPSHQLILYAPIPLDFLQNDPVEADTQAVFTHAVWHVTDKLNLTGGLRYTEESKDYTFSRLNRDGTPNAFLGALNGVTATYEGSQVDYRANADYRWTDRLMTYVQVSTGFKGGGIGPRPFVREQARAFGPEKLTAYEVGVKSTLANGTVRLNAAAFFNDYTDIQLTLLSCPQFGGPGPCALPQNAGDAEMKGVEVEIEAQPVDGLTFDVSASYLDFEYTRIDPLAGGPAQPGGVQLGMITPFTPEVKASAGVQYEFELDAGGSLTPRVDVSYQDELYTNAVNGPNNLVDSRTLSNARLTWRSPSQDTSISAEVTNLTGKYYYVSKFDLSSAAGIAAAQVGAPRMWAVTLRHNF